MPRPRSARSLSPYTAVPQVNLKVTAADAVSSATTAAAWRMARVGPQRETRAMAATASAPATMAAVTCTWLTVVCGAPGRSFGATPATTQAAPYSVTQRVRVFPRCPAYCRRALAPATTSSP
jgi:hypothetical protein